jgi:hypothetical protein
MNYIQQRVMELRNNDYLMNQFMQRNDIATESALQPAQHRHMWQRQQASPAAAPAPAAFGQGQAVDDFDTYRLRARPALNPYTKVPLLSRRRKYPSFY